MASVLRTILVDSDAESLTTLRRVFASSAAAVIVGEFPDIGQALIEGPTRNPDLMIVEVPRHLATQGADAATRMIENVSQTLPSTAVLVTGPSLPADFVIKLIRAGAVEFLTRPVERVDILAALDKLARFHRGSAPARKLGRMTSVFSTKGGLGVTTMAANLAVSLASRASESVLLVDLDSRQSDIATFLNLRTTYSVLDAFENVGRMDESFLRGLLVRHGSGLWVLPGPQRMERIQFGAEPVRIGLEVMRSYFDHIVLDLRHDLDPGTVAALELSDTILYLTSLDVPAIRSAMAGLAAFRQLGVSQQRLKVVVMRDDTAEDMTTKQVRDALGLPIFWRVPNDYQAVMSSINTGNPVVLASPRSKIARSVTQLSDWVGQQKPSGRGQPKHRGFSLKRLVWNTKETPGA
jgi:pilus assembly protein CpaE